MGECRREAFREALWWTKAQLYIHSSTWSVSVCLWTTCTDSPWTLVHAYPAMIITARSSPSKYVCGRRVHAYKCVFGPLVRVIESECLRAIKMPFMSTQWIFMLCDCYAHIKMCFEMDLLRTELTHTHTPALLVKLSCANQEWYQSQGIINQWCKQR